MQRLAALVAGAARRRSGGSDCWGIAATLRAFGSSPSPAAAAATPGAAPSGAVDPSRIRNWCICAHVDHGKTTLFDRLLAQCDVSLSGERAMDSGALEKERGITILSKVCAHARPRRRTVHAPGPTPQGAPKSPAARNLFRV
jgi:hypothetical protein